MKKKIKSKKKSKLRKREVKFLLLISTTIMTVVVGIATILSFNNSKDVQRKLVKMEELRFAPEIKIERYTDTVLNCNNEKEEMYVVNVLNEGYKILRSRYVDVTPFISINTQFNKKDTILMIPLNNRAYLSDFQASQGKLFTFKSVDIFDAFEQLEAEVFRLGELMKGDDFYRLMGPIRLGHFVSLNYKDFLGNYVHNYYFDDYRGKYLKQISSHDGNLYWDAQREGIPDRIDEINPARLLEISLGEIPKNYHKGWVSGK